MGGNNSWTHPPFFSRHLVPQNVGNIIFSILDWGPKKVNVLLTSPSNQFRDYFIWNRIEKLMPQHWNFSPQTLKTLKTTDQLVFKPRLFAEIWVSKNPGFVHGFSNDFPWISSPPPPWIFGEAAGAADKKCGGVWGEGREPPPRISRPGSLGRAL